MKLVVGGSVINLATRLVFSARKPNLWVHTILHVFDCERDVEKGVATASDGKADNNGDCSPLAGLWSCRGRGAWRLGGQLGEEGRAAGGGAHCHRALWG